MEKDRHCSYCGVAFAAGTSFPRTCAGCSAITYRNPIPVAVLLLPVDDGLLGIRRGIEPKRGELALPGGFVDAADDSWQAAAARELFEETGIEIGAAHVTDFAARSTGKGGPVLLFGVGPRLSSGDLPSFTATNETVERVILSATDRLAFPLHEWALKEYFARVR